MLCSVSPQFLSTNSCFGGKKNPKNLKSNLWLEIVLVLCQITIKFFLFFSTELEHFQVRVLKKTYKVHWHIWMSILLSCVLFFIWIAAFWVRISCASGLLSSSQIWWILWCPWKVIWKWGQHTHRKTARGGQINVHIWLAFGNSAAWPNISRI